ncbi:NAD-dependent epimerase/dehydratase family protein [Haloarchaeobius amylolyticus]|uniref:NAD-dependent epimerase/dehydratase family protein n=1 Tax=Haloarchaeobius amylolyticus TaxID=1198296 RepID=UPI002272154C|nr:NAD-dependent epimerase/dehydratase family protein [Haloarchaeobius amylolyticus]
MRYLVTGETGFVTHRLVDRLLVGGHEVTVLVQNPEEAIDLAESGCMVCGGHVAAKERIRHAFEDVDRVFHLGGRSLADHRDPAAIARVNVRGTRNVLELAREHDVEKVVYRGSLAANSDTGGMLVGEDYRFEGPHRSVYDETMWRARHEVAEPMAAEGVPVVTVLPGAIYGPDGRLSLRDRTVDWLDGTLPVVPRKTAFCWAHVDDAVEGYVAAMDRGVPGETYITAGEPHTLAEAVQRASEVLGRDPPRTVPAAWFMGVSRLAELAERVVSLPDEYSSEALRVLAGATYLGDNAKARRELGIEHRPLAEGLQQVLAPEQLTPGPASDGPRSATYQG